MIVVNLFSGPGVGKSTMAAHIFAELKRGGLEAEYCHEWIKWELWAKNTNIVNDQICVFAQQHRLQSSLRDQVDVCVCDSPLLMSLVYGKIYDVGSDNFYGLVRERHHSFQNMNFYVERHWPYGDSGRYQPEADARALDTSIYTSLIEEEIDFEVVKPTDDAVEHIVYKIEELARLEKNLKEALYDAERVRLEEQGSR